VRAGQGLAVAPPGAAGPVLAASALSRSDDALDARWLPAIRTLGFVDVPTYLRQRHLIEHLTVNAIASEVGLSFHCQVGAHAARIELQAHVAKRHAEQSRVREVAAYLGVDSISEFIEHSKTQGWTWQQMAAVSVQPETWLRRHADQ
jgi:hypothetical protein